jgi:hypothetical protein
MTFPILYWTKDPLAEQAAHFRLIGSVVDGLWLGYLAIGTIQN